MVTTESGRRNRLIDQYRRVMDRIASAAIRVGRQPQDVAMVAVTKTASPDQIRTLVDLGQTDLAEGRVQQLTQRAANLDEYLARKHKLAGTASPPESGWQPDRAPRAVRWHLVGHLQRNKVKQIVSLVTMIHSLDNLRLAEDLHALAALADRVMDVLIQVNLVGGANRSGLFPPAVVHFAEQIDTMAHLRLRGLMTMAGPSENPEDARGTFVRTAEMYQEIRSAGIGGDDFNILSMGMSSDYEVAVEEGANLVRIGRALFAEEPPAP